ncbi:MAG: DUF4494 domain-containing protein [Bacteroidales bacterium]
MSTWFECKVKYMKMDQNGKEKMVSEPYLVDAVSFTEAEKRIHEMLEPYISGEFNVTNIKRALYSELIPNETGDRWYKVKVVFIGYDEEKKTEKRTSTNMLIQASSVKEAFENTENSMKGMVSDFEIPSVQESAIMDVFPYFEKEKEETKAEITED